jgi:hypothetical protein
VYSRKTTSFPQLQKEGFIYKVDETDERWFGNYE